MSLLPQMRDAFYLLACYQKNGLDYAQRLQGPPRQHIH
jgi:hypothetical protein